MTKEGNYMEIGNLRDFDWKLLHILGASTLATHQENLVLLDLHVAEPAAVNAKVPHIKQTVSIELNHDDLDKFISALEACQEKLLMGN